MNSAQADAFGGSHLSADLEATRIRHPLSPPLHRIDARLQHSPAKRKFLASVSFHFTAHGNPDLVPFALHPPAGATQPNLVVAQGVWLFP